MQAAAKPINEKRRLEALRRLAILDTPPEERFDRITNLAARSFDVSIALVSLVDADRQWFKSCYGVTETETPRNISFCAHAILQRDALIINDALEDERFATNPMVTKEPHIRFYAGYPLYTPDQHVVGTLCIADTTPREFNAESFEMLRLYARWAQQEMNAVELNRAFNVVTESEARFRSIFSHSPSGLAVIGIDGRCLQTNQTLCDMFGYTARELAHLNFQSLTHPDDVAEDLQWTQRALSGEINHYTLEKRYVHKQGHALWVLLAASLVRDSENLPAYFIFQLQNITERKQLEQMRSDFLAAAAHELRSPMTSVYGFAQLLMERDFDEPRRRELLGIIHAQSSHMTHLINELLNLSRMQSKVGRHFELVRQPVESIITTAVNGFLIPEGRQPVELRFAHDLPQIAVDAEKIQEVLHNLLSNAYKYSPYGGTVRVTVQADAHAMQISVRDQGLGMSAAEVAKIFDPFFRAANTSHIRGTGLGMTLVKEIIQAHGGRIDVVSEPGKGTEISVALPL